MTDQPATGDDSETTIWINGDSWRDLTDELLNIASTVVTENGTARLLDPTGETQIRLPLTGRHRIAQDGVWQPLLAIRHASPCGLYTTSRGRWDWHITTRVIAVLPGHHPDWTTGDAGQALLADVTRQGPLALNHPDIACPVAYCSLANGTPRDWRG